MRAPIPSGAAPPSTSRLRRTRISLISRSTFPSSPRETCDEDHEHRRRTHYALRVCEGVYASWMPTRLDEGPFRYLYRVINPITCMLVRRFRVGGPSDDLLRVLRVRGRTSGRPLTCRCVLTR